MGNAIFVIHHPDEDDWAGQLAGELAGSGLRVTRGAALGRTDRGRQVMARHIESAGVCLVLWTELSCADALVNAQAQHAVRNAVATLVVTRGDPAEDAPLGLPSHAWDGDATALVAEVTALLAWQAAEAGQSWIVPAPARPSWRRHSSTSCWLAAAMATITTIALAVVGASLGTSRGDEAPFVASSNAASAAPRGRRPGRRCMASLHGAALADGMPGR